MDQARTLSFEARPTKRDESETKQTPASILPSSSLRAIGISDEGALHLINTLSKHAVDHLQTIVDMRHRWCPGGLEPSALGPWRPGWPHKGLFCGGHDHDRHLRCHLYADRRSFFSFIFICLQHNFVKTAHTVSFCLQNP